MHQNSHSELLDLASTRIAVIPVGNISKEKLDECMMILNSFRVIPRHNVTPPGDWNSDKTLLKRMSWMDDHMFFNFELNPIDDADWLHFHTHKKTLAVIGICHCPTAKDIMLAYQEYKDKLPKFEHAQVHHLFAFEPLAEHWEDKKLESLKDLVLFPNQRQLDGGASIVKVHMEVILCNICSTLVQKIDGWAKLALRGKFSDSLRTMMDSGGLDTKKKKKRQLGRANKWIGDHFLLVGSPRDAIRHYTQAVDLCKVSGDAIWLGGAYHGLACAAFLIENQPAPTHSPTSGNKNMNHHIRQQRSFSSKSDNGCPLMAIPTYSPEVVSKLEDAITQYQKFSRAPLQTDVLFQLAFYLLNLNEPRRIQALDALVRAKDVPGRSVQTQIVVTLQVAAICDRMGFKRKFTFFICQVASMYRELEQWPTAHSLYLLVAERYGLSRLLPKKKLVKDAKDNEFAFKKTHNNETPQFGWFYLQRQLLEQLLSLAKLMNDPEATAEYCVAILKLMSTDQKSRVHVPLKKNIEGSERLTMDSFLSGLGVGVGLVATPSLPKAEDVVEELQLVSQNLPPNAEVDMTGIPELKSIEPIPLRSFLSAQPKEIPKELQTEDDKNENGNGPSDSGGVYYNPFEKKGTLVKPKIRWVSQSVATVRLSLYNPTSIPLEITSIKPICSGASVERYSSTVTLPPKASTVVCPSVKPLEAGKIKLIGIEVVLFGLKCKHYLSENALNDQTEIEIIPALPLVLLRQEVFESRFPSVIDGQLKPGVLVLDNVGTMPVGWLRVQCVLAGNTERRIDVLDGNSQLSPMTPASPQTPVSTSSLPNTYSPLASQIYRDDGTSTVANPDLVFDLDGITPITMENPLLPKENFRLPFFLRGQHDVSSIRFCVEVADGPLAPYSRTSQLIVPLRVQSGLEVINLDMSSSVLPLSRVILGDVENGLSEFFVNHRNSQASSSSSLSSSSSKRVICKPRNLKKGSSSSSMLHHHQQHRLSLSQTPALLTDDTHCNVAVTVHNNSTGTFSLSLMPKWNDPLFVANHSTSSVFSKNKQSTSTFTEAIIGGGDTKRVVVNVPKSIEDNSSSSSSSFSNFLRKCLDIRWSTSHGSRGFLHLPSAFVADVPNNRLTKSNLSFSWNMEHSTPSSNTVLPQVGPIHISGRAMSSLSHQSSVDSSSNTITSTIGKSLQISLNITSTSGNSEVAVRIVPSKDSVVILGQDMTVVKMEPIAKGSRRTHGSHSFHICGIEAGKVQLLACGTTMMSNEKNNSDNDLMKNEEEDHSTNHEPDEFAICDDVSWAHQPLNVCIR